jgi:glycosyltransferase involved in cell wall biosynthesis
MEQGPLVSTIIPTYNRANLVPEAIDSVLAQTYPHVEVILIDDGSTDGTLEVLRRYGDRIHVISQPNAGPAAARNRGVMAAQGEMIAFLDSDDLWLPEKLARQVNLLQRLGEAVPCCLCNINMRWKDRELTSFDVAWLNPVVAEGVWHNPEEILATRFVLFNQGVVIRREVLREIGGFDESFWLLEDYDLALRLSLRGDWGFIRDPLVIWRESATSRLSRDAERDDLRWKLPLVEILEKQLYRVSDGTHNTHHRKQLHCELKRARRQLTAARMSQMTFPGALFLSKTLDKVEQYRNALHRRSPWFPQMDAGSFQEPSKAAL